MKRSVAPQWVLAGAGLSLLIASLLIRINAQHLWVHSVDLGLHYALVVRISELGHAPTGEDPSLGLMNGYPDLAHTLAANWGQVVHSRIMGMQLTALASLMLVWAASGIMFAILPRREALALLVVAPVTFLLNGGLLHLELFGNEIIVNWFFAQMAAQAAALGALTLAAILEHSGLPSVARNAGLGIAVPIVAQIHPLPALEVLLALGILILLDALTKTRGQSHRQLVVGTLIWITSALSTVLAPSFATMRRNAENNGVLDLRYTQSAESVAVLALLVAVAAAAMLARTVVRRNEPRVEINTVHKYWACLALAISVLCLLQYMLLAVGPGSSYAVKKYALGLNTIVLLGVALFIAQLAGRLLSFRWIERHGQLANILSALLPAVLLLTTVSAILPSPSERTISVREIEAMERFATANRASAPGAVSGRYDYAVGMYPSERIIDLMISIGILHAPQTRNLDDFWLGRLPSNPRRIDRLLSRVGAVPWDVPSCRTFVSSDAFVVLNGACVLKVVMPH